MLLETHAPQTALGVTFGALRFGTHFRLPTMCSETAMIRMLLGTHVPQTTVGVTFGARHRSSPLGFWDRLLGHSGLQDRPRTPERVCLASVRAIDIAPGRLQNLTATRPRLHPDLWSGIFRRRERHAHEVARRHRAGSGDRENPTRAGAKSFPGLPVKTGFP